MKKAKQPAPETPKSTLLAPGLALLAFLLYAGTLGHGFVLDDVLVITKNKFTIQGIGGWSEIFTTDTFTGYYQQKGAVPEITGGRYRPFSLAVFALLYQITGAKPLLYHLLNLLLYSATAFVLFKTLHQMLHRNEQEQWNSVAFVATLLFVLHPVHTEVVANIKCADELWCMLLSLLTLKFVLNGVDSGQTKWAWRAGLSFLAACFSKENAFTYLAVIPLAVYFFRPQPAISLIKLLWPSLLAAFVFFLVRGSVLHWRFGDDAGVLINNPFIKWNGNDWIPFSFAEKSAAIIYSLGEYVRLLIFPHPLTHDYYPRQIGMPGWGDWQVWLSLAAGAAIIAGAAMGLGKKSKLSFALLYYIFTISIVSNIFFPIGTNLSERFIFMPSVAFCLLGALALLRLKQQNLIIGATALIAIAFAGKTWTRNTVWKDNLKLASTDIAVSGNSAKLNNSYAAQLSEKALKSADPAEKFALTDQAIRYYSKALEINPNYVEAIYGRGSASFIRQDYPNALNDYLAAEKISPGYPNLQNNLVLAMRETAKMMLQKTEMQAQAVQLLKEAQRRFPGDPEINNLLQSFNK